MYRAFRQQWLLGIEEEYPLRQRYGKDILSGKRMGYRTVGITHGFMNGEQLRKYGPDVMIKELGELVKREEIFL